MGGHGNRAADQPMSIDAEPDFLEVTEDAPSSTERVFSPCLDDGTKAIRDVEVGN